MTHPKACPVCRGHDVVPIAEFPSVPVLCNQLWSSAEEARAAPVGTISLDLCRRCAAIWNSAFDPRRMDYTPGYENALHFSPAFRTFASELAEQLVARYDLAGGTIVEIGCGDGFMLDQMRSHGAARAIGFDPSMAGRATRFTERDGVEIKPEYFETRHLAEAVDLLLCRHTLEHVDDPLTFLRGVRSALGGRDVPVYFEVPNATWLLSAPSPWDVIYEHVTYWTAPAIEVLFRRAGFVPLSVRTGFRDQFLMIEARPGSPEDVVAAPDRTEHITALAGRFSKAFREDLDQWTQRLSGLQRGVVIWGAGSKGISFANVLSGQGQRVDALVDVNPRKHGRFIPGVGLKVVAPEDLPKLDPKVVLISNGLYRGEIASQIHGMRLDPAFMSISGVCGAG